MDTPGHLSPQSFHSASLPTLRRVSTDDVEPARAASETEGSSSDNTSTVQSDSAYQTPQRSISALSLPLSGAHQRDSSRRANARDSGIETSTPTIRIHGQFSQSLPNINALLPPGEDRPDLWRNDVEPPTFRPRVEGIDAAAQLQATRLDGVGVPEPNQSTHPPLRGARRVLAFLGYGTGDRYRKDLVAVVWTLSSGFIQIAVTLSLIIYSSIHHSPRQPSLTEWKVCDKPLGLWSCFWIVKVVLDCCMSYWGLKRDWKDRGQRRAGGDVEQGTPNLDPIAPVDTPNADPPAMGSVDRRRRRIEANSLHSRLYSRLSILLSLIIISWFLTSNILLFTSLDTCRFDAPHLWWLVFSLLCLQYVVILEVFATAMIVFIIGPLIYLFWSIILICLGRHPLQNPHYISPEVGKVSRSVVDQIPLVLYIPTPPEDEKKHGISSQGTEAVMRLESIATPKTGAEHTYPPKPAPKRRFTFLSRKSTKSTVRGDSLGKTTTVGEKPVTTWEDCWESGEFPFVRLDEHRASCAICLLDFEEPKRRVASEVIRSWAQKNKGEKPEDNDQSVVGKTAAEPEAGLGQASSSNLVSPSSQVEVQHTSSQPTEVDLQDTISLRLQDSGEGAQPLRLLHCGHAFHKTCIDPWLTDVSGRCPTCQRPVVAPPAPKRKRSRPDA